MDECELPEGEGLGLLLLNARHLHGPEVNGLVEVGPVLVALDPAPLHLGGQHDDEARLLLPDHLPEVGARVG